MLIFNGKIYAKNNKEFTESLFNTSGTCNGFYKRIRSGVQLFNIQHELTAFIVNRSDKDRFIVSAGTDNGKPRYMFGLSTAAEKWLGIDGNSFAGDRNAISNMRFIP